MGQPSDVKELPTIAEESSAQVLRGPLRYPSDSGSWQLGDIDCGEHPAKYRDHRVEKEQYICGVCGFALTDAREYTRA